MLLADGIEDYLANGEWRPSTRSAYTRALKARKPVRGGVPVDEIRPVQVQKALTTWKQAGTGARTVQQRWQYLHSCLEAAYHLEMVDRNPRQRRKRHQMGPETGRGLHTGL